MEMLGGRGGTDAGVPQRSHPGLGGNRVQPGRAPRDRAVRRSNVSRKRPTCCGPVLPASALRDAFRLEGPRRQRQSDGTISLEGVRFEIPARYRHFRDVSVRYARWDLSRVDLVDPRQRNDSGSASIRWTGRPTPMASACCSSSTRPACRPATASQPSQPPSRPGASSPPNCRRC